MSQSPKKLGVVGVGKIVRDQHLPSIDASADFELVASASRNAQVDGIASYKTIDDMLDASQIDAVALCVPPQVRYPAAISALSAGKHLLLEKPPGATISEVQHLARLAEEAGVTLYASWHSRQAAAVQTAKNWLANHKVNAVALTWKEDVRKWHPGQEWIWEAGGLGVFDSAINGLSIITECLGADLFVKQSSLMIPSNKSAPIAAQVDMQCSQGFKVSCVFDWDVEQDQREIDFHTDEGLLRLYDDGNKLSLNGSDLEVPNPSKHGEYLGVYQRFANLIDQSKSDADFSPLVLVADAFINGKPIACPPFVE